MNCSKVLKMQLKLRIYATKMSHCMQGHFFFHNRFAYFFPRFVVFSSQLPP